MFKSAGTWWNDRNIEMIEVDDHFYALDGFNGESYLHCWEAGGPYLMDVIRDDITITPVYGAFNEIDDYEVYYR